MLTMCHFEQHPYHVLLVHLGQHSADGRFALEILSLERVPEESALSLSHADADPEEGSER